MNSPPALLRRHGASLLLDNLVHELPYLPTAADAHGQQALEPADLDPALAHEHDDLVASAEGGDGEKGQLLLLLEVEIEEGVGGLVGGGVGGGGARGAGGDVVGHGDAGVDEGEGGGVDEGGEEGAVLGEDVQGDAYRAVGEEVGVQGGCEGVGDGGFELLGASGEESGLGVSLVVL